MRVCEVAMQSPCKKDCPDRSATCHAECEAYLQFLEENAKERERIHVSKKVNGYIRDSVRASKKKSRTWKGKV